MNEKHLQLKLQELFYLLMRDAAPVGAVRQILKQVEDNDSIENIYTNKPLADMAYIYAVAFIEGRKPDYERIYWAAPNASVQATTLDVDSTIPPGVDIKL